MHHFMARQLLRILSIVMATILWFYVLNSEPIEANKRIKLTYILPAGKAISSEAPHELLVKVKGARAFLRSLYEQEEAVVDLSKISNGKDQFSVAIGNENLPASFGITIVSITPKAFDISLDKIIRKEITVREQLVGDLPSEYRLVAHSLTPNKVMISGPISLMRKTSLLRTEPIDISRLLSESEVKVGLEMIDPRIKLESTPHFAFKYEVRAQNSNVLFDAVPLRFISSHRQFFSKQQKVSVSVLVSPKNSGIVQNDIQAVVDIPEGKKGWMRLKVRVLLPPDVHLLKINPEEISVKVK